MYYNLIKLCTNVCTFVQQRYQNHFHKTVASLFLPAASYNFMLAILQMLPRKLQRSKKDGRMGRKKELVANE